MEWQKKLRSIPVLYWFSRRMSLWGTISFNLAVFINLIIAFFYPYDSGQVGAIDDSLLLMVFWILTGLSVLGLFSQRYGLQPLTIALIIRSIYHLGLGNTLILLGSLNLINKVVFVVSFVGNNGTFIMGYKAMSVTRNGRSILLTALLALILVYLFSIVGFLFLKEDFIMEVDPLAQIAAAPPQSEASRDFLKSCSAEEVSCVAESEVEEDGLERDKFDNKTVSFEEHIKLEHNIWNYLYFIVLLREKNKTDYTGPESYVAHYDKEQQPGLVSTDAGNVSGSH
ncbi:hypothetical protein fugu_006664 [Takifugu bimaculatus]|uniref:Ion transport domain-containing protein n=1 Tax=Takifugu bimaculatus TaxID=433685 RepID=A0A4Z2B250_9TELE|nr:hypothetical protein fugu_006664 [Takifugu bimaculatus]